MQVLHRGTIATPSFFSWLSVFAKVSSSLNRPVKVLLWIIHRSLQDNTLKSQQQTYSAVTHMVDDILVYDEQTHVSMEITLQKKEK